MAMHNTNDVKYVYDLPYPVHRELCRLLDQNDKWEELAGMYMKYNMQEISYLRRPQIRSPTEELLSVYGQRNHTIYELFVHLSKMQHHQAMLVLKPFIDRKYHVLINEGEENITRLLGSGKGKAQNSTGHLYSHNQTTSVNIHSNENINFSTKKHSPPKYEEKILNIQPDCNLDKSVSSTLSSGCAGKEATVVHKVVGSVAGKPTSPATLSPEPALSGDMSVFSEASCSTNHQIPYKELCIATNLWDQKNILGRGGFGIRGSSQPTRANHQAQLDQSYKELKFLNTLRQDNILPLYGFSVDGEQPCLVYQLMPNGSLEDRLQCKGTEPLSWEQRHKIALGTSRGLQFLHTRYDKPLIHGDIKSANILLDSDWTPRIGDFGLAREGPIAKYTHIKVTSIHGTKPYLPVDFLRSKQTSTKVDTYSFGIVLFEIATGQRAYDRHRKPELLKDLMRNAEVPSRHMDRLAPLDRQNPMLGMLVFTELVSLGRTCTAVSPKERPEMPVVFQDLENLQKRRDIVSRAEIVVQSPTPCPSNPLELQMLYEAQGRHRHGSGESPCHASPSPWELPKNPNMLDRYLKLDIPPHHDDNNFNPYQVLQVAAGGESTAVPPSISPSVMLPAEYQYLSTPSTLPTSNPFPNGLQVVSNSLTPHHLSPNMLAYSNLHPPSSAVSPLLVYQNQLQEEHFPATLTDASKLSTTGSFNDLRNQIACQAQVVQPPQNDRRNTGGVVESGDLPDLSILGIALQDPEPCPEQNLPSVVSQESGVSSSSLMQDSYPAVLSDILS
ncbi:hypothetical protein B566_EDAN001117 [Ephemera danica]|nr:hypothetical protein B566_EDAN001117 [Ephemera danica]